jgi:hypothetical protein
MTTETVATVTTIAQATSPLDSVFNALVKAVADRIMTQVLESQELETKVSSIMDMLIEDKDIDDDIEHWMRNNFDIDDYSDQIHQMTEVDEDQIKDIIRNMEFTFSAT